MENIIVIYSSKYGATIKYARWIADTLSCDILERKEVTTERLDNYTMVIYGGGLYAGGVLGVKLIKRYWDKLKNKQIIIFTVGLADPQDKTNIQSIQQGLNKKLSSAIMDKVKVFHFRGAIDYSKLNFIHKAMMAMLHRMVSKKEHDSLTTEDKEMLKTYGHVVDFTDKRAIIPLVSYIQELQMK